MTKLLGAKPIDPTKPKRTATKRTAVAVPESTMRATMNELFGKENWKLVTTEEQLLEYIENRPELGFDTETTGLQAHDNQVIGFSLGDADSCIYVPLTHHTGQNYTGDKSRLNDILNSRKLIGFNFKFDAKHMRVSLGVDIKCVWDGFIAARMLDSSQPANLKERYVMDVDKNDNVYDFRELFGSTQFYENYDPAVVGAYGAVDAKKHFILAKWQIQKMEAEEPKMLRMMHKLELPLMHHLIEIELTGIKLDVDYCNTMSLELDKQEERIKEEIKAEYGEINLASPKQLGDLLYNRLRLPLIDFGKPSTGEDILKRLNHPVCKKILEYRHVAKLNSTYIKKMPTVAINGTIYCNFNQVGADTGRFSSDSPNLQNIPRQKGVRDMFIARPGSMLISTDYSQQEPRVLASVSNDEKLRQAYVEGKDFYAFMASVVFNKPYETCVKGGANIELRNAMKSVVLAAMYDQSPHTLAEILGISRDLAYSHYNAMMSQCPALKAFRAEKQAFAKKHGYVETILGWKRRFTALHRPDFTCDDPKVEAHINTLKDESTIRRLIEDAGKEGIQIRDLRKQKIMEIRQVVNSIIQGSSAQMTKLAMINIADDEELKRLGYKILLTVHDEIIGECPTENAEAAKDRVVEIMQGVGEELINLPITSEPNIMARWSK